jgi:hypothetical protein
MIVVMHSRSSRAEAKDRPLVYALGPSAGVSVATVPHDPAFYAGLAGSAHVGITSRFLAGASFRAQLYRHKEDEDFGSAGAQADLLLGLRADAFPVADLHPVYPFITLRAGPSLAHRVPYCRGCTSEEIPGVLVGGSVGVDLGTGPQRARFEVALDRPSFTFHDDTAPIAWELSVLLMLVSLR